MLLSGTKTGSCPTEIMGKALLRGSQAVVAGDPHQLPPTTFFMSSTEEAEAEENDEDVDSKITAEVAAAAERELTQGQESILDVMRARAPVYSAGTTGRATSG